eukprot:jgi/Mesvir1/7907/Mv25291-RA.1
MLGLSWHSACSRRACTLLGHGLTILHYCCCIPLSWGVWSLGDRGGRGGRVPGLVANVDGRPLPVRTPGGPPWSAGAGGRSAIAPVAVVAAPGSSRRPR